MATILAVDDSQTMMNMICQTLTLGGYKVVSAMDGIEGVSRFSEHNVDLILTDINMPGMNGIAFVKSIRAKNTGVPILVLSTEFEESLKKSGLDAGANGWIVKPFRPAQLLDIVKQVLAV